MAKQIIGERAEALVRIAEALLEREVLEGGEVRHLIDGVPLAPSSTSKSTDDNKGQQVIRPDQGAPMPLPKLTGGDRPLPA